MATLLEDTLTRLADLGIHATQAEVVTWQGRQALRLEDGLALVPTHQLAEASIEVLVGADGVHLLLCHAQARAGLGGAT